MNGDLKFDYKALRYIELRGDGSRLPAREWGGYDQDFDEAEYVHTHDEIEMMPGREWGVVDVEDPDHASMALLIFDLDTYKAPEDFDPARVTIPSDTLAVRSQSGGLHVYYKINGARRGEYQESDFKINDDLPFEIDIRGSSVSMHVVAPSDIPSIGGGYEVVENESISAVFDPADAANRITIDGEPAIEFEPGTRMEGFDFERAEEPPEDMPTCYHAGLELRKAAPDDHPNTHKVNMLTAACGLAAGYGPGDVTEHFVGEWAPGDECDVGKTEYQVGQIKRGEYAAPTEQTLRDYGILDPGEGCDADCPIPYHGPNEEASPDWPVYDVVESANIELHLIPISGKEVKVVIEQNGTRAYDEKEERGFWTSGTKRGRVAGRVADVVTGADPDDIRAGVKQALNQASIDADKDEDSWKESMRSELEKDLRGRTVKVVCYPAADEAEWVVTMQPPEDSSVSSPQEITFDQGDFNDANAGSFRNAHLATFYKKVELDANEWFDLVEYWLDIQETKEREPDHKQDAAVEKFKQWVQTMQVWADEEGYDPGNRNGYYWSDYDGDADAICIPGQKVVEWQNREDFDDVNLSRALKERGILLASSSREYIDGYQHSVWPVDAGVTNHTPESAHSVVDEDDEDEKPEGLR